MQRRRPTASHTGYSGRSSPASPTSRPPKRGHPPISIEAASRCSGQVTKDRCGFSASSRIWSSGDAIRNHRPEVTGLGSTAPGPKGRPRSYVWFPRNPGSHGLGFNGSRPEGKATELRMVSPESENPYRSGQSACFAQRWARVNANFRFHRFGGNRPDCRLPGSCRSI